MDFTYNKNTQRYKLGETEYTENEFIAYIKAGMLATALTQNGNFEIEETSTPSTRIKEKLTNQACAWRQWRD